MSQLRYYWSTTKQDCEIGQMNAKFQYGFEMTNTKNRLIVTPLTNRCLLAITTALSFKFCVNLQGVHHNGKEALMHDLAQAFGMFLVHFTCNEGTTRGVIIRTIKGNWLLVKILLLA
jgi:dynein heavy chain